MLVGIDGGVDVGDVVANTDSSLSLPLLGAIVGDVLGSSDGSLVVDATVGCFEELLLGPTVGMPVGIFVR